MDTNKSKITGGNFYVNQKRNNATLSTLFILYHSSFVSEHLGADVEWFENEYKVVITKPEKK